MSKTRVALINAGFEKGEKGIIVSPPLGIMSIGAYLRENGLEVTLFDWSGEPLDEAKREALVKLRPDVVGLTVIIGTSMTRSRTVSQWSRGLGAKVVWGGPTPSVLMDMCLTQAPVDYLVVGEGEQTMLELCRALEAKTDVKKVDGLAFMENGAVAKTAPRKRMLDLDSLPMPLWQDLGSLERFLIPFHGRMAIPMVTSRGCPGRCSFCYTKTMWGYRWTSRSAAKVVDEIQLVQRLEPRVGGVIFDDDLFAGDVRRIEEFCEVLDQRDVDIVWNCEIRAKDIKEPFLAKMKGAGCAEVLVGVETGSDRLLGDVMKGVKKEEIIEAFRVIHKLEVRGNAMLMVGMPGEKMEDFEQTKSLLKQLKADGFYFSMFLPAPGTEFYEVAKRAGFKDPATLDEWARLGGLDYTSYPQRSLSEVPWPLVKKMIEKQFRSARRRDNWRAFKRDPFGSVARLLTGGSKSKAERAP